MADPISYEKFLEELMALGKKKLLEKETCQGVEHLVRCVVPEERFSAWSEAQQFLSARYSIPCENFIKQLMKLGERALSKKDALGEVINLVTPLVVAGTPNVKWEAKQFMNARYPISCEDFVTQFAQLKEKEVPVLEKMGRLIRIKREYAEFVECNSMLENEKKRFYKELADYRKQLNDQASPIVLQDEVVLDLCSQFMSLWKPSFLDMMNSFAASHGELKARARSPR